MSEPRDERCGELWRRLVLAEQAFYTARAGVFSACRNELVELTRKGLEDPHQRITALGVASLLTIDERKSLLPDVLPLACTIHGQTEVARGLVLGLPRQWLMDNIEQVAEPLLRFDDYELYRGLFQIYLELDRKLASSLAERATQHPDPEIREAGEDFLRVLKHQA